MSNPYTAAPAPVPAKPRSKHGVWYTAGLIATAVVSFSLGNVEQPPVTAEPVPAVTVTAEPEVVEVEVTPASCDLALTRAEEIFGVAAEFADAASASITAASTFDLAGMEAATLTIQSLNGTIEAIDYNTPAAECRAGL